MAWPAICENEPTGGDRKGTDDLEIESKEQLKKELEEEFDENLAKLLKARDEFVDVSQKDLAGTS
jgi:hypothetical protein